MACIVRGCRSRPKNKENSGENISFHGFPKNEVLRSKWFAATCRSEEHYKKYWKVCSRHFAPTNFVGGNLLRAYLKENSVPTLNLPHKSDMMGMDEEIEDIVGEVQYTDSQKSVATNVQPVTYSPDFTDSSSDKNNSFGKETYVIEWDSEDDSFPLVPLRDSKSVFNLNDRLNRRVSRKFDTSSSDHNSLQSASSNHSCATETHNSSHSVKSVCTSLRSLIVQGTCTQTSKTIIELAEKAGAFLRPEQRTLETQTSKIRITENKTIEYMVEVCRTNSNHNGDQNEHLDNLNTSGDTMKPVSAASANFLDFVCNRYAESLNERSKLSVESDNSNEESAEISDERSDRSRTTDLNLESPMSTDMEEDSLMVPTNSTASKIDIHELREQLNERIDLCRERYAEPEFNRFGTLTPLTEESNHKRENLYDITPFSDIVSNEGQKDDVLFTSNAGMRVKLLKECDNFKLPPIQNQSWPNSPQLCSLFSNKLNELYKAGTLPSLCERSREMLDQWNGVGKNPAAGEGVNHDSGNDSARRKNVLPPIHAEGSGVSERERRECQNQAPIPPCSAESLQPPDTAKPISIKEKIKELKFNDKRPCSNTTKFHNVSKADSRSRSGSRSPSNGSTSDEHHRPCEVREKGCEALLGEIMGRLRGANWYDVVETLEEMPTAMARFWGVITEHRVADLLRTINTLIESPRPQLSRAACSTAAVILTNTNYTKKPDFFETMAVLLTKTGSYSVSVRRAANLALDGVVCGLAHWPVVTALCLHGVGHASAVVRAAAARLLLVSCALRGGAGRALLGGGAGGAARPSAAAARRLALRALAALLADRSADTRKYAERLYTMLRPLKNFEAYYLTDVQVDTAARQMKKYDQLLDWGQKETT